MHGTAALEGCLGQHPHLDERRGGQREHHGEVDELQQAGM